MPPGIAEHGEDLAWSCGHSPLHFESFHHGPIVAREPLEAQKRP